MGGAGTRVEHTQVVHHLGDGADSGARVVADRLLLDGNRGREAADEVHARLLHLAEELARIGGKALDVAALPLGVDRVEGQRRLAAAADAGEHDELVAGDGDIHMPQVVLLRAANDDLIRFHRRPLLGDDEDFTTEDTEEAVGYGGELSGDESEHLDESHPISIPAKPDISCQDIVLGYLAV